MCGFYHFYFFAIVIVHNCSYTLLTLRVTPFSFNYDRNLIIFTRHPIVPAIMWPFSHYVTFFQSQTISTCIRKGDWVLSVTVHTYGFFLILEHRCFCTCSYIYRRNKYHRILTLIGFTGSCLTYVTLSMSHYIYMYFFKIGVIPFLLTIGSDLIPNRVSSLTSVCVYKVIFFKNFLSRTVHDSPLIYISMGSIKRFFRQK